MTALGGLCVIIFVCAMHRQHLKIQKSCWSSCESLVFSRNQGLGRTNSGTRSPGSCPGPLPSACTKVMAVCLCTHPPAAKGKGNCRRSPWCLLTFSQGPLTREAGEALMGQYFQGLYIQIIRLLVVLNFKPLRVKREGTV